MFSSFITFTTHLQNTVTDNSRHLLIISVTRIPWTQISSRLKIYPFHQCLDLSSSNCHELSTVSLSHYTTSDKWLSHFDKRSVNCDCEIKRSFDTQWVRNKVTYKAVKKWKSFISGEETHIFFLFSLFYMYVIKRPRQQQPFHSHRLHPAFHGLLTVDRCVQV